MTEVSSSPASAKNAEATPPTGYNPEATTPSAGTTLLIKEGVDELARLSESGELEEFKIKAINERLPVVKGGLEVALKSPKGKVKQRLNEFLRQHKVSYRTFQNWKKAYLEGGALALAPDYGKRKAAELAPDLVKFIRRCWLSEMRPNVSAVCDDVAAFCEVNKYEATPSRYQVEQVIKAIPPDVQERCRGGKRAWQEKYEYHTLRDWDIAVNALWCADHRQFDVFVINPQTGQASRPWLTAWEDMGSRAITGWRFSFKPNSDTAALSLRDGILRCGRPDEAYMDNGKDFVSYYLSGQSRKFRVNFDERRKLAVMTRLNMKITLALPFRPQSKPIESLFKFFSNRFDRKLPGWCGRNTADRPEKLAGEIKAGKLLTFEEFIQQCEEWIKKYNTAHVHSTTGKTPFSFYESAQVVYLSQIEIDFILFRTKEQVVVKRRGVRLLGADYVSDEMMRLVSPGECVNIRFDPADMESILVFDGENRFLCRAPRRGKVAAINTAREDWAIEGSIKKAQRERLRSQVNYYKHGLAAAGEKLVSFPPSSGNGAQPGKSGSAPAPVYRKGLGVITQEGLMAKAVERSDNSSPASAKGAEATPPKGYNEGLAQLSAEGTPSAEADPRCGQEGYRERPDFDLFAEVSKNGGLKKTGTDDLDWGILGRPVLGEKKKKETDWGIFKK